MSINSSVTNRRKTNSFATRLLHKALSERDKKNTGEMHRPTPVPINETEREEEHKLASTGSELSG